MGTSLHNSYFREGAKRAIQALLIALIILPLVVTAQAPAQTEAQK